MSGKTVIIYKILKIISKIDAGYTSEQVIREIDIRKTINYDPKSHHQTNNACVDII